MTASFATSPGISPGLIPNETLEQARELGHLGPGVSRQEVGSIGAGPDGAADVQWYSFTLDGPALVNFGLSRTDRASSFDGVLSLFDNDPNDFLDPYDPDGHRLLEQVDGKADGGVASFDRLLGPGTYDLAVSGDGNFDFHPLLAGSGLPGSTGDFNLQIGAAGAGLDSAIGPQVLTSDPTPGGTLSASPLAIRIDLSGALDPSTAIAGQTVQLIESPDGRFALDGQQVPLASINVTSAVADTSGAALHYQGLDELQLFPASPLAPGHYEVLLAGQPVEGSMVLADPLGNALGADASHPRGQDVAIPFQVDGIDGIAGATASDDTASAAHDLGDVTSAGLVQVAGAIGDDPYYNPANSADPSDPDPAYNPGNQVDLYHFHIDGTATYSMVAEVFAGRIGSPLDPGVSLFRLDPSDGLLEFVAGNNNTYDPAVSTDGSYTPLYSDSALDVSLTAGDYYLAVAGGWNTPSPFEGLPSGSPGLFDPNVSHSGTAGWSTGPYVLNLIVQPASSPPHVVSTTPAAGTTLTQAPSQVTVTFDEPVNVAQLAFETFQTSFQDTVSAIYIEGADGTPYFPRFLSYDGTTNQATFYLLDPLPDGDYFLHLSGPAGLADLGGNPLVANDPSGDFVVAFTVAASDRGDAGDPLSRTDQEPNDDLQHPQDLGVLFPNELATGVTITRDFSQDPSQAPRDTADVYEFQIIEGGFYTFTLTGAALPPGLTLTLTDPSGQAIPIGAYGDMLLGQLAAGTYVLTVGGWGADQAAAVSYQVSLDLTSGTDNAPPLLSGPAPAVAILLASDAPPTSPTPPPPVTPPPVTPPPIDPPTIDPPTTPTPTTTPVVDPPTVAGPSPVGPPSIGTEPSSIASPTSTPAELAIAIPPQLQGGPLSYGTISTDVVALAASPVGGVVALESAQATSTALAQSTAAVPQSSLTAGLIILGTSLQVLGPGEESGTTPAEPEAPEDLLTEVRDEASPVASGERLSDDSRPRSLATELAADVPPDGGNRLAPSTEPPVEAPPEPSLAEASSDSTPAEARPDARARVVILTVAALTLGVYARNRRSIRRDVDSGERRVPPRPLMTKRPGFHRIGMRRGLA